MRPQDDLRFWPGYASLIAGIVFILIANVGDKARSVILWISFIPAIGCPVLYFAEYQARTAPYGDSRVICGMVYTAKGADYASKNPGKSNEDLIRDFAGRTGEIWTDDSINQSRLLLGLSYSAAIGFFGFAALAGLERVKPPRTHSATGAI